MAGVERAKRALWSLLRSYNAKGSAKLTVTTVKGKLKVILEESFDVQPTAIKATKRPSPSQLRRKERRAADPAVQQRAAEHQARVAPVETGEVLASPEKERASYCNLFCRLQIYKQPNCQLKQPNFRLQPRQQLGPKKTRHLLRLPRPRLKLLSQLRPNLNQLRPFHASIAAAEDSIRLVNPF